MRQQLSKIQLTMFASFIGQQSVFAEFLHQFVHATMTEVRYRCHQRSRNQFVVLLAHFYLKTFIQTNGRHTEIEVTNIVSIAQHKKISYRSENTEIFCGQVSQYSHIQLAHRGKSISFHAIYLINVRPDHKPKIKINKIDLTLTH